MLKYGIFSVFFIFIAQAALSQDAQSLGLPALTSSLNDNGEMQYSLSLQVLALMTAITLIPSLILGMSSFTRIIIVLSILRQALGTQQTPPNQVLIAIALFLSFYIMEPTLSLIYEVALDPYLKENIGANQAILNAREVIYGFLISNTRPETITMFAELRGIEQFESSDDVPLSILMPSFIT
jgi:flagellar biosynthetic protein FliP